MVNGKYVWPLKLDKEAWAMPEITNTVLSTKILEKTRSAIFAVFNVFVVSEFLSFTVESQ